MTTVTLGYRAIHHKIKLISFPKINYKIFYLLAILLSLLILMLIFYVYSINELTKGTYLIKNYNKEIDNLSKENRVLQTNFAESGFLEKVQEKVKELSFEKTKEIKYIQILESSLADAQQSNVK